MSDHSGTVPTAKPTAEELTAGVSLIVEAVRSLLGPSIVMFVQADEHGSVMAPGQNDDPEVTELAVAALAERARAWGADASSSIGYEAVTVAP
jgi:hypothetical protein